MNLQQTTSITVSNMYSDISKFDSPTLLLKFFNKTKDVSLKIGTNDCSTFELNEEFSDFRIGFHSDPSFVLKKQTNKHICLIYLNQFKSLWANTNISWWKFHCWVVIDKNVVYWNMLMMLKLPLYRPVYLNWFVDMVPNTILMVCQHFQTIPPLCYVNRLLFSLGRK